MIACEIPLFPKVGTFFEMSSRRFGLSCVKNDGFSACGRDLKKKKKKKSDLGGFLDGVGCVIRDILCYYWPGRRVYL